MPPLPKPKPHLTQNPANIPASKGPGPKPPDVTETADVKAFRTEVALDLLQMVTDLIGFVDPTGAADGASAVISLARGDFWGAAISAVSAAVPYVGDAAKLAKIPKYTRTVEKAVGMAKRSREVAKLIEEPMKQLRGLLRMLPPQVAELDFFKFLRGKVDEYFQTAHVLTRPLLEIVQAAKKNGSVTGQFAQGVRPLSVAEFLDRIVYPAAVHKTSPLGQNVNPLLDLMATRKWHLTAPVHRSASDAAPHATVMIQGVHGQYHFRVNKQGVLYQVSHLDDAHITDPKALNSIRPH